MGVQKDFYQLTEQQVSVYKDDKHIGNGLCFGIFENFWEDDDYERAEDEYFIVVDNKILVEGKDYEYDDVVWGSEYEMSKSEDLTKIKKMYDDMKNEYSLMGS